MQEIKIVFQIFERIRMRNWIKIMLIELGILGLAIITYINRGNYSGYNISIVLILIAIGLFVLYMHIRKLRLIKYCRTHYQTNKKEVIELLKKQKKFRYRYFNFRMEDKLFVRLLYLLTKNKR